MPRGKGEFKSRSLATLAEPNRYTIRLFRPGVAQWCAITNGYRNFRGGDAVSRGSIADRLKGGSQESPGFFGCIHLEYALVTGRLKLASQFIRLFILRTVTNARVVRDDVKWRDCAVYLSLIIRDQNDDRQCEMKRRFQALADQCAWLMSRPTRQFGLTRTINVALISSGHWCVKMRLN